MALFYGIINLTRLLKIARTVTVLVGSGLLAHLILPVLMSLTVYLSIMILSSKLHLYRWSQLV